MKLAEVVVAVACVGVFGAVLGNHFRQPLKDFQGYLGEAARSRKLEALRISSQCADPAEVILVDGGQVCRGNVPASLYREIFDTFPATSGGSEQVYRDLSMGDVASANKILANVFPIDRFGDFDATSGITWEEGLVDEPYWRYLYYGFRSVRHLFAAFDSTLDPVYLLKAKEIALDFARRGTAVEAAWVDSHAVAFRSMFLVKTWWQLRTYNLATYEESELLLREIEAHGRYLEDPNNNEATYNHAINQAAALYLIASNFPQMGPGTLWTELATERLDDSLEAVVGDDGVLVENSPYYHLNALEKFWQVYDYSLIHGPTIGAHAVEKLGKMIDFVTYILRPDRSVPLLGASIHRVVNHSGLYRDMAESNQELLFVLTNGKEGSPPTENSVLYPNSGLAVLRSGWTPGVSDVHVTFDVGRYRTNHSDLDALSFTLYGNGSNIVQDAGLFSYERGPVRDYFHGTRGHNTVLVDGQDQKTGDVEVGELVATETYSSLSGQHDLYPGVSHSRSLTLIQDKYLLIIDRLESDVPHEYRQLFHFSADATVTGSGSLLVVSQGGTPRLAIHQLADADMQLELTTAQQAPMQGYCSAEYSKMQPCAVAEYVKNDDLAWFITVLELGAPDPSAQFTHAFGQVEIESKSESITISYAETRNSLELQDISVTKSAETAQQPAPKVSETGPAIVIVFDDGYQSILPAIEAMRQRGLKGNIGVIADRVDGHMNGYLNLALLQKFQNEYGWNIVNHSRHHVPAAERYGGDIGASELEQDITSGARFLVDNGINSAPNWYIYPFSSLDESTKAVVGKYYRFARTTQRGGAPFPFADPLGVTTISSDAVESGEGKVFVPIDNLIGRVDEAVAKDDPVIVTFHRIRSRDTDPPGYELADFTDFLDHVVASGVPVLTFSEFDAWNGVDIPEMKVNDNGLRLDLSVEISSKRTSWLRDFLGL